MSSEDTELSKGKTKRILNAWADATTASSMDIAFTAAIRKELVIEVRYFEFASEVEFNLSFPLNWFYTTGATLESELPPPLIDAMHKLGSVLRLTHPNPKKIQYGELCYYLTYFNETVNQDLAKIKFNTLEA